jgi:hypothetical protein
VGSHTISATPYSAGGATGTAGATLTYTFNITNTSTAPAPAPTPAPSTGGIAVNSFTLYRADTDQAITTLSNGATIDFAKIGTNQLSIVANVGSDTRSVRFGLDGNANFRLENAAPYAIAGDWSFTDLAPWTPTLGGHTLSATPFNVTGATGTQGATNTIWFNVVNSGTTTTAPAPVPSGTTAGAPAAVVSIKDNTINAGGAAFVNGLASTLNAGDPQTARFEWDFGDYGSRNNNLVGWNAAHVYDRAGNYNVTLRGTNEAGKTSSATGTVYVAAASRRQIYVSAWSGNDANDGAFDRPVRTFDRARNMLADNVEILFKGGETFTMGTAMYVTGRKNVLVGSYGGSRAILKYDGPLNLGSSIFTTGSGSDGVTFQDMVLDSRYPEPNTY